MADSNITKRALAAALREIINFNTPQTLNAIGIATSDTSEMALREISAAVRNVQIEAKRQNRTFARNITSQYDKGRKQPERSENNERNHLHETGGLPYTRPDIPTEPELPLGRYVLMHRDCYI